MKSGFDAGHRMSDITLKQVRGFLAASQCATFRQAAPLVFLSYAAFASAIQELEASLGEELFVRTSHGNQLTGAGTAFLPHAQRLMDSYSAALACVVAWRSAEHNRFALAGCAIAMPTVLPTLLGQLHTNFEAPAFVYEDGTSQQVIDSVLQGRASSGVCTVLAEQPELHCTTLLQAPLGLLAHPNFALPASICTLADLNGVSLVRYSKDSVVTQLLELHAASFGAYHNARTVSTNVSAAYAMVQSGLVAAVTSGMGATHPQAQGMRFVPLPGLLPMLSVSLISRRGTVCNDQQALMKELTRVSVLNAQWHGSVAPCHPEPQQPENNQPELNVQNNNGVVDSKEV